MANDEKVEIQGQGYIDTPMPLESALSPKLKEALEAVKSGVKQWDKGDMLPQASDENRNPPSLSHSNLGNLALLNTQGEMPVETPQTTR